MPFWRKDSNDEDYKQDRLDLQHKATAKMQGKPVNLVKVFDQMSWWPSEKFTKTQEAPWMTCPYSSSNLVYVGSTDERKRKDISPYIEQQLQRKKLWYRREINDELLDVKRLMNDLNRLVGDFKEEEQPDKKNDKVTKKIIDHRNCHTLFPRSLVNKDLLAGKKAKNNTIPTNIDKFYSTIQFIIPSQLTQGKNTLCEVQLDVFLRDEKSRTPELQVVSFMYQLVLAMSWIHEKGYVHGDIRAANAYVFKKEQNWLARLCLPGAGSLINYVKDGYGYYNVPNLKDIRVDNENYRRRNEHNENMDVRPLGAGSEGNKILTSSFKKLSKPPGPDRAAVRASIRNLTKDDCRGTIRSRNKNRNRVGSIADDHHASKKRTFSLDDLTVSSNDNTPFSSAKHKSADNDYIQKMASRHSIIANGRKKLDWAILVNTKDENTGESMGQLRTKVESVYWQPPEIHKRIVAETLDPKKNFNKRTDIYQLGCTMWEMITYGNIPFRHKLNKTITTHSAARIIKSNIFENHDQLDEPRERYTLPLASWNQLRLQEVIEKCMKVTPSTRPTITQIEMYHMVNVLSENGLTVYDAQCKCGKGNKPEEQRKFFLFF